MDNTWYYLWQKGNRRNSTTSVGSLTTANSRLQLATVSDETTTISITCFSDEASTMTKYCTQVLAETRNKNPYQLPSSLKVLEDKDNSTIEAPKKTTRKALFERKTTVNDESTGFDGRRLIIHGGGGNPVKNRVIASAFAFLFVHVLEPQLRIRLILYALSLQRQCAFESVRKAISWRGVYINAAMVVFPV
ncbi:hypothetical protein Tco_0752875 [Tanacetum coccineum]